MNAYEEMLRIMRREGNRNSAPPIQIGIMDSPTSCSIGKLKLSNKDLLIAEHLKTGYYFAICEEEPSRKDKDTYIGGLKEGDKVAIYRISDSLYIILERLV